jgi:hypothetical protein
MIFGFVPAPIMQAISLLFFSSVQLPSTSCHKEYTEPSAISKPVHVNSSFWVLERNSIIGMIRPQVIG